VEITKIQIQKTKLKKHINVQARLYGNGLFDDNLQTELRSKNFSNQWFVYKFWIQNAIAAKKNRQS